MIPKALVLTGFGINCDVETAFAFKMAGAEAKRVHINDLINGKDRMEDYHIMALPGGFSYGDDIASAKVLANKLRYNLYDQIMSFIEEGKLIIGICNGFQALVKMGLLPRFYGKVEQTVTLTFNDSGRFEDRWVYLKMEKTNCVFTKGLERIYLPVRHGEGKFVPRDDAVLRMLREKNLIVVRYADNEWNPTMTYPMNPNGSVDAIAGICDSSGRVFGLMPHPEAYLFRENHPRWPRSESPEEGMGLRIFKNAVDFITERF